MSAEHPAAQTHAETIRDVLRQPVNGEYSRELAARALDALVTEVEELRAWKAEAMRLYEQRQARRGRRCDVCYRVPPHHLRVCPNRRRFAINDLIKHEIVLALERRSAMTDQEQIKVIRHALDELGLALTDHDHVWSPELRAAFDAADRLLRTMEKVAA